ILGSEAIYNGKVNLATSHLFNFSEKFINEYLPYTIELGRSFIQPNYQSTGADRKGIFALDNLWDGLGSLTVIYPHVKYFFGKVTMYPDFNKKARDLIIYFLKKYFGDTEQLLTPIYPVQCQHTEEELEKELNGANYLENYKILSQKVRQLGEVIPPLINSYMNLSPTMKVFGTALNKEFGNVEETGLLITISDIYNTKKDRHILTFKIGKRVFKFKTR
ncbi:MAG: hemolysin, partial [Bacteroidales bacterium]|nr:hemolysin [Bacteroidales bacterium]